MSNRKKFEEEEMNKVAAVLLEPEQEPEQEPEPEQEQEQEQKQEKKQEQEQEYVTGIVTDCLALAVRSEGSFVGKIIYLLKTKDEVRVRLNESTENFYAVTNGNISGFCSKSFIKLK